MVHLVARRFQVLGEPCRLRILGAIQDGAKTVGEIVDEVGGSQPNISKHLQVLYDAGLVGRQRRGNNILYDISDPVVVKLCELVCRSTAKQASKVQKYATAPYRGRS
jgi:DNA-binding transcriptional ArsR family regulator